MAKPFPEYVIYLLEQMAPLGPVRARGMFGGHGIFLDDLMFGLVIDEELYLKVDDGNRAFFEMHALPAFQYMKNGKAFNMSYYLAPEDALEDSAELCVVANNAIAAALRQRKPKNPPRQA